MFPTYAKIRDSISRFRRTYLLNLELVSIGSFLLTALIFIYIPEVIHLVLGDRWMPAALPIRILCFSGIIRSVTATTGELFKAVGKPHYLKRYSFYQLLILLAIIIPAIYLYGLVGACLAVIIPKLAVQGFAIAKVCKIIRIRMSGFFSRLVNPTISVLLMSLISLPLKNLLASALPGLVFSIVISVSIYAAAIMILRKGLIRDISML
jgi:O-antigen/teichoic acid export membrane protein